MQSNWCWQSTPSLFIPLSECLYVNGNWCHFNRQRFSLQSTSCAMSNFDYTRWICTRICTCRNKNVKKQERKAVGGPVWRSWARVCLSFSSFVLFLISIIAHSMKLSENRWKGSDTGLKLFLLMQHLLYYRSEYSSAQPSFFSLLSGQYGVTVFVCCFVYRCPKQHS